MTVRLVFTFVTVIRKPLQITFVSLDNDECLSPETNECHLNAMCTNIEGSYVCRCKRGYTGDGENCSGKMSTSVQFSSDQTSLWFFLKFFFSFKYFYNVKEYLCKIFLLRSWWVRKFCIKQVWRQRLVYQYWRILCLSLFKRLPGWWKELHR